MGHTVTILTAAWLLAQSPYPTWTYSSPASACHAGACEAAAPFCGHAPFCSMGLRGRLGMGCSVCAACRPCLCERLQDCLRSLRSRIACRLPRCCCMRRCAWTGGCYSSCATMVGCGSCGSAVQHQPPASPDPEVPAAPSPVMHIPSHVGEPPLLDLARRTENSPPPATLAFETEGELVSCQFPLVCQQSVRVATISVATIDFQAPETASLSPELHKAVSHAEDYRSVTGQLHRIANQWIMIYSANENSDRFGGRFVLELPSNAACTPGTLVTVRGAVVPGATENSPARYRAVSVDVVR